MNQRYAMLTLASALCELFRVQLYWNNAHTLLLHILSILNLDWILHAHSVQSVWMEINLWMCNYCLTCRQSHTHINTHNLSECGPTTHYHALMCIVVKVMSSHLKQYDCNAFTNQFFSNNNWLSLDLHILTQSQLATTVVFHTTPCLGTPSWRPHRSRYLLQRGPFHQSPAAPSFVLQGNMPMHKRQDSTLSTQCRSQPGKNTILWKRNIKKYLVFHSIQSTLLLSSSPLRPQRT